MSEDREPIVRLDEGQDRLLEDTRSDPQPAIERDGSRRELLGKIAKYSVYMPPALVAGLKVAAPLPSALPR